MPIPIRFGIGILNLLSPQFNTRFAINRKRFHRLILFVYSMHIAGLIPLERYLKTSGLVSKLGPKISFDLFLTIKNHDFDQFM